jgi:hypothetical protein
MCYVMGSFTVDHFLYVMGLFYGESFLFIAYAFDSNTYMWWASYVYAVVRSIWLFFKVK